MIKVFRQNVILQLLLILAAGLLMWGRAFLHPIAMPSPESFAPLYRLVYRLLSPFPIVASIIAFVLVLVEGGILNSLLYSHKLIPQHTLLPMFLYVTTVGACAAGLTLTPLLLVNLVLLLIMHQILIDSTLLSLPLNKTFAASALVAVAVMIYAPAMLLLIPLLIVFTLYKLYNWRDWMMLLLGFAAPCILLAFYYFMTDKIDIAANNLQQIMTRWNTTIDVHDWRGLVKDGFFVVLMLTVLLFTQNVLNEKVVLFRQNALVIITLALWGVLSIPYQQLLPFGLQAFAIPFAFASCVFFLTFKGNTRLIDAILVAWTTIYII